MTTSSRYWSINQQLLKIPFPPETFVSARHCPEGSERYRDMGKNSKSDVSMPAFDLKTPSGYNLGFNEIHLMIIEVSSCNLMRFLLKHTS